MAADVLIVDDETRMRDLVRRYLQREGLRVIEAANGWEALVKLEQETFSLIILDLMMPEMDGWEFCRRLRQRSQVPLLMLTARSAIEERVLGLNLGADDYLPKPFDPRELVARVRVLLRRHTAHAEGKRETVERGDLVIEPLQHQVLFQGDEVTLTPKEFDLLLLLARHPGRVFTRDQLLQRVWGMDYGGETRTVDTHIRNLREKLGGAEVGKRLVVTVWGVGYKFEGGAT